MALNWSIYFNKYWPIIFVQGNMWQNYTGLHRTISHPELSISRHVSTVDEVSSKYNNFYQSYTGTIDMTQFWRLYS